MDVIELIGWAAASMTLLAFTARDVRLLRWASVGASLAFIAYGAAAAAWPVLALHCLLLPVNLLRLRELRRQARDAKARKPADHGSPADESGQPCSLPGATAGPPSAPIPPSSRRLTLGGDTGAL